MTKLNPVVQKFAEQAGITTNIDTDYFEKDINKWVDYYSQKFAELIVQECSDIVDQWKKEPFPLDADVLSREIRKHFGVK